MPRWRGLDRLNVAEVQRALVLLKLPCVTFRDAKSPRQTKRCSKSISDFSDPSRGPQQRWQLAFAARRKAEPYKPLAVAIAAEFQSLTQKPQLVEHATSDV